MWVTFNEKFVSFRYIIDNMETLSALLTLCTGNPLVSFPLSRSVMQSGFFFGMNKLLNN